MGYENLGTVLDFLTFLAAESAVLDMWPLTLDSAFHKSFCIFVHEIDIAALHPSG